MDNEKSLRKYALLVATMASFLSPFMSNAINLAIPSIGKAFNSSTVLLNWVVTCYILVSAVIVLPSGRLGDILGRKRVFVLGLAIFSFSSLLCASAWSTQSLIFFRIMQGAGAAMSYSTATAIVSSVFPPNGRGKALGLVTTATYIGFALGPFLGGGLTYNLGWQSVFYFAFLISAVVLVFTVKGLKGEWAEAKGESFDISGTALYMMGMVAFIYGLSSIATASWAKYVLVVGIGFLVVFIRNELITEQPILNFRLFRENTTFIFSNLAALIYFISTSTINYLLSLHLQVGLGYDPQIAGLILLSQPLIMAVLSPFAGTLSERINPRIIAACGMGLATLGLSIFCFISFGMPVYLVVGNLIILGSGAAFFSSPNTNCVMGAVPRQFYGVASSTLGTMRNIGQAISMATIALIINYFIGGAQLGPSNAFLFEKSLRMAFALFTFIGLSGIVASLAKTHTRYKGRAR